MKKSILALFLAVILVIALVPFSVSAAEGKAVSTAAEFEGMTSGEKYYLSKDIDFGGKKYDSCILEEFSGVLDGNGFSIFNFSIESTIEADTGIIKRANKVSTLEIKNLTIGKDGSPITFISSASGKSHGVICGAQENANSMTLTNVTIYANVNIPTAGKANVGGFIGYSRIVTIKDCKMYGKVEVGSGIDQIDAVYHNAGGFIGSVNNDLTVLENCENNAEIIAYCSTVEARAAGLVTYAGTGISFTNCVNNGNVTVYDCGSQMADGQAAGIIAHINKSTPAVLDYCENNGKITASNWCGGFIAQVTAGALFTGCINNGEYNKSAIANGPFSAYIKEGAIVDYENCVDKTDPNAPAVTTPADTTTAAPVVTDAPAPVTTPAAVVTDAPTEAPATSAQTPDVTEAVTTAPKAEKKGCGSAMMSIGIIAVLGCAWTAVRKKK